jgi:hypothetical protein
MSGVDRSDLDDVLAGAEDVVTDWQGGIDAMHARPPETDDVEAIPGDSYYEQAWWQVVSVLFDDAGLAAMLEQFEAPFRDAFDQMAASFELLSQMIQQPGHAAE